MSLVAINTIILLWGGGGDILPVLAGDIIFLYPPLNTIPSCLSLPGIPAACRGERLSSLVLSPVLILPACFAHPRTLAVIMWVTNP